MRMTHFLKVLLVAVLCSFSISTAYAADKKPIQIQLGGNLIGTGLGVGYHVNDVVFIGLDYMTASMESESTDTSGTVKQELDFSTQIFLARISPFSGSFYFQAGLVSRNWEASATGVSQIGDSSGVGVVTAKATFPSTGYAFGLGWNWIADFGLSGGLGFGLISGGVPEADLSAVATAGTFNQEDLDEEEKKFQKDMEVFSSFPYAGITIGWNF